MLLTPWLFLASGASAKLWGWGNEFTIVARMRFKDPFQIWKPDVCEGWGNWCDKSKCTGLEKFDIDLGKVDKGKERWWEDGVTHVHFDWARIQRKEGAWIDLWRRNDGRFDMYENEKGDHPHGFCEPVSNPGNDLPPRKNCDNAETIVCLACYQY